MKKIIFLLILVFVCSTNLFALEDDVLYKYINVDACLSAGTTDTYDDKGDERSMASIGFLGNVAFGLQYNRFRFELSYQERAEVSELIQTMFGLVSTLSIQAGMFNAYYDYLRCEHFAMYIGTGVGVDHYKLTMKDWTDYYEDSGYSCIIGGYTGLTFIIKQFSIDLGINYYYIDKPRNHTFAPKISFRYAF